MKIYKVASTRLLIGQFFWIGVALLCLLFPTTPNTVRIFSLIFILILVCGTFALLRQEITIQNDEIELKNWKKRESLTWREITEAYLSGNPDFPMRREALHLVGRDKYSHLMIFYYPFRQKETFLQDILSHLPSSCKIDPDLIGFANDEKKYRWKLFFKTEAKTILILIALTPVLFFITWLLIGFIYNYWHWSL